MTVLSFENGVYSCKGYRTCTHKTGTQQDTSRNSRVLKARAKIVFGIND